MIAAFLTAFFFALSVVSASRSAALLGAASANFSRMLVALVALAVFAFTFGKGLGGGALGWFVLSGLLGFGLGDVALYLAIPRLGPRLTLMLAQCLAAPFAAGIERVWLGTTLTAPELLWGGVILGGVALALSPSRSVGRQEHLVSGVIYGVLAGLGQALGAVTSRQAYAVAVESIDGGTAAFQRMLGGIGVAALFFALVKFREAVRSPVETGMPALERWRRSWRWVVLNGLAGPAIGVGCYQWALASTPSAIVLPIVALAPVVIIPLTIWLEGDRPSRRSLVGAGIAVVGAAALALAMAAGQS